MLASTYAILSLFNLEHLFACFHASSKSPVNTKTFGCSMRTLTWLVYVKMYGIPYAWFVQISLITSGNFPCTKELRSANLCPGYWFQEGRISVWFTPKWQVLPRFTLYMPCFGCAAAWFLWCWYFLPMQCGLCPLRTWCKWLICVHPSFKNCPSLKHVLIKLGEGQWFSFQN